MTADDADNTTIRQISNLWNLSGVFHSAEPLPGLKSSAPMCCVASTNKSLAQTNKSGGAVRATKRA